MLLQTYFSIWNNAIQQLDVTVTYSEKETDFDYLMFSRNHLRKILHTLHIVDNTMIPAMDDPSYIYIYQVYDWLFLSW